jgi:4-hydroxybenzoate polyprenyltransferase
MVTFFFNESHCAFVVNVMNDLADIASDREHPSKRNRPFASGELSISVGLVLGPLLWMLGIFLSLLLSKEAMSILLVYSLLAIAYTFCFKRKLVADVVVLALLYTIRIIVGGIAT